MRSPSGFALALVVPIAAHAAAAAESDVAFLLIGDAGAPARSEPVLQALAHEAGRDAE